MSIAASLFGERVGHLIREYPQAPVTAVAGVVLKEEEVSAKGGRRSLSVLLVKRAKPPSMGKWSLPGGVLELGEMLQDGLVREVQEETGLLVKPVALLEVLDHIVREPTHKSVEISLTHVTNDSIDVRVRFHYVLIDFVCRVQSGEVTAASDALEARWVQRRDIEEEAGFALSGETVRVIQKAFHLADEGLVFGA